MSAVLGRILALMKKEFLAVLKDARSRVLLVVPPMIQQCSHMRSTG